MGDVPYIKRKQGELLRRRERQMVVNVFNYVKAKNQERSVSWVASETAEATGISRATVFKIRTAATRGVLVSPSKKRQPKGTRQNSRILKYNDFVRSAIRRKVHEFYFRNQPPTLNSVLAVVNSDPDLPDFKRSTLHKLLNEIGFTYERRANKAMLIEREDIVSWRHRYLSQIKRFRCDNRNIVYSDESWVNTGITIQKAWSDKSINTPRQAFLEGLSRGLKAPTGRGPRYALVHAGNEKGFVPNAQMVFLCKKNTADAHDEMDGECYEKYFHDQILEHLPPRSVIVIDNASYHSRKKEQLPTKSWNKDRLREWLKAHDIDYDDDMLKLELMNIIYAVRHKYDAYKIDDVAKEMGHTVLRLPPYHCELNPIELVWAQVKHHIRMNNTTFKRGHMERLIQDGFDTVSVENWNNYVQHVKKIETEMWQADNLQDDTDRIIIHLGDSSSEEEVTVSEQEDDRFDKNLDVNEPNE